MSLTNAQYDTIIRDYGRAQIRHRHLLEARVREVYRALPAVKEVDDAVANFSVTCARALLSGDASATGRLEKELALLGEKRQHLLEAGGFPQDYLEMTYDCADCKDTGYVGGQKCHCFKQAQIHLLYTQSRLREILQTENFQTFSFQYYSDQITEKPGGESSLARMKKAVDACRRFVRDFDSQAGNLFLYGDTGVGKTFLSHCVAKELLDSTHSVVYFTAQELFDLLAHERFARTDNPDMGCDAIYDCDLLILDDLGTEFTNSLVNTEFFSCINERLLNRRGTVISTNLSLSQFAERYSERIFSRISMHYTFLKLFGQDIRLLQKTKANPI